jgi:hypothetical protein
MKTQLRLDLAIRSELLNLFSYQLRWEPPDDFDMIVEFTKGYIRGGVLQDVWTGQTVLHALHAYMNNKVEDLILSEAK